MLQKLAGADHTTLLLNCYTKLKDVSKLDAFLRGSGAAEGSSSLPFDAETAVKVNALPGQHCSTPALCRVTAVFCRRTGDYLCRTYRKRNLSKEDQCVCWALSIVLTLSATLYYPKREQQPSVLL